MGMEGGECVPRDGENGSGGNEDGDEERDGGDKVAESKRHDAAAALRAGDVYGRADMLSVPMPRCARAFC